MSGEHVAPKRELDDPNKRRREKHTPVGMIRKPLKMPPMVPIKADDGRLADELAAVEEQIG